ncbi:hypothetical protein CAEBREN_28635 [Caenorhabditis brenneri]|uniref:Serpentine receptor class gamma n=1 Tax=Caenorhabditis brenneri TaxID=135651 RepID=G0MSB7_CAEBE|nr:hypothetical protein CAEBREN_28635 [Caenorhabditis brenneri]
MEELPDPSIRTCEYKDLTVVGQTVFFIVQLGYALPISILYLYVILKVLRAHKTEQGFSDEYFKLYVMDGCVFWKKHTTHVMIVALTCPVLCTWQLAISPTRFDPYVGQGILGYVKVVPFVRTTFFKLFVSFAAFLFILYANIRTYMLTRKFKIHLKGLEKALTLSTVVMSLVFVIYIIIQVFLLVFSTAFLVQNITFGSILKKVEFICNDFYLMSSPIVLLIMNRRLRSKMFRIAPEVPQNSSNTRATSKNGDTVKVIMKSPSAKTLTMW